MEWISVEERLPEDRMHYLVACTWNGIRWVTKLLWDGYRFHIKQAGSIVTHWQPLPEPPKALPLFYMQPGSWLCPIHTVYLRGYGRIIALADQVKAQILCDKLNHAWALDLDKGST